MRKLGDKDRAYIVDHPEISASAMAEELGIAPGTVLLVRQRANPPPSPIEADREFFAVAVLAELAQRQRINLEVSERLIADSLESTEKGVRNVLDDAKRHGLLDECLNFLTG